MLEFKHPFGLMLTIVLAIMVMRQLSNRNDDVKLSLVLRVALSVMHSRECARSNVGMSERAGKKEGRRAGGGECGATTMRTAFSLFVRGLAAPRPRLRGCAPSEAEPRREQASPPTGLSAIPGQ